MGLIDKVQSINSIKKKKPGATNINPVSQAKASQLNVHNILETGIDRVYKKVLISKKIRLDELSSKIGIDITRIEELAKILEKKGLITVNYPMFGKPELLAWDYKTKKRGVATEKRNLIIFGGSISIIVIIIIVLLKIYSFI